MGQVDPAPAVRRPSRPANKFVESHSRKDTSPTRRIAPRTLSILMIPSWSCLGTALSPVQAERRSETVFPVCLCPLW